VPEPEPWPELHHCCYLQVKTGSSSKSIFFELFKPREKSRSWNRIILFYRGRIRGHLTRFFPVKDFSSNSPKIFQFFPEVGIAIFFLGPLIANPLFFFESAKR
jgi:hypothetical protein